ncbi:MAG TPA: TIGR01212 family radical SAM protein, partial [Prevotella sp.]
VSQAPANLLIAPKWGLKNYQFTNLLMQHLKRTGSFQGQHVQ